MKKRTTRIGSTAWMLVGLLGLAACSTGSVVNKTPVHPASPNGGAHDAPSGYAAPAEAHASKGALPSFDSARGAAPSAHEESMRKEAPAASERPGLGTEWGETRFSHVSHTSFDRADAHHPSQVVSLFYNDREGARAMARYADYREMGSAVVNVSGLGVAISLNDDNGLPLPAFYADGRTYAIGEAGQRYTIVVRNDTGMRIEAVGSVDGLDVLDGQAASFDNRGYLVPAWGSVEIDGFRQTNEHVAAFRFGSVRDSYAARAGSDRNVGIVGVAIFTPRGASSWPWSNREVERRRSANPFPGSYASPPPPRW